MGEFFRPLARIAHHLVVEARHRPAIASLRLLAVFIVLFKYVYARQAARASHGRVFHALRLTMW